MPIIKLAASAALLGGAGVTHVVALRVTSSPGGNNINEAPAETQNVKPESPDTRMQKHAPESPGCFSWGKAFLPRSLKYNEDIIGNKTNSKYEVEKKKLGSGAFAHVFPCQDGAGNKAALKTLNKKAAAGDPYHQGLIELNRNEIETLDWIRRNPHENVVKVFEIIEDEEKAHVVMERLEGGDLYNYIYTANNSSWFPDFNLFNERARLDEPLPDAKLLMQQALSAIDHLHSHGIAHFDIKPENLMLTGQKTLKLIDFGFAEKEGEEDFGTYKRGSRHYVSPEMLEPNRKGNLKSDIWSAGVVLFAMLTRTPLFPGKEEECLKEVRRFEGFNARWFHRFRYPSKIEKLSAEARDILSNMIERYPENRPTAKRCLRHKWFVGEKGWDSDWLEKEFLFEGELKDPTIPTDSRGKRSAKKRMWLDEEQKKKRT